MFFEGGKGIKKNVSAVVLKNLFWAWKGLGKESGLLIQSANVKCHKSK